MKQMSSVHQVQQKNFHQLIDYIVLDENGQTLTEYALLVLFVGLAGLVLVKLFPMAIRGYLKRLIFLVPLPIP